ncbi:MAG: CHAD domain-containing protein [Myxococcota bacterium]
MTRQEASTFALDLSRPFADELRRVLLDQADKARVPLAAEGPTEPVVHAARKASKRARAVAYLLRPTIGGTAWRVVDVAFRDAARLLGPLRDADVARHTLGPDAPPRPDLPDIEARAIGAYQAAYDAAMALDLQNVGQDALVAGLAASWRNARQASRVLDPTDPETFHDWRKVVKRLFYQVQLISSLDEPVLGSLVKQLDVLQEALGDHHDTLVAAELTAPTEALLTRRRELEGQTVPLGRWLFGAGPRRFARLLTQTLAEPSVAQGV